MVGSDVARIDWSTEPRNTGSIMLVTMMVFSRWPSGAGSAGATSCSMTLASMNASSAARFWRRNAPGGTAFGEVIPANTAAVIDGPAHGRPTHGRPTHGRFAARQAVSADFYVLSGLS